MAHDSLPTRIACLSTEAVEILYRLGAQDRIAGISGYSVYPPQARREKPKVSAFSTLKIDRLLAVKPDLVIGFSDLQRPLLDQCVARGLPVLWFDHRDLAGIHTMIATLGALVECREQAAVLSASLHEQAQSIEQQASQLPRRPRVYFEEWDEPMICGIGWVSELIAIAGGVDVFADQAGGAGAKARIVGVDQVTAAAPELLVGSWCGKRFVPKKVKARPGWPVSVSRMVEIKSADILSPGPAALERGLPQLFAHIAALSRSSNV